MTHAIDIIIPTYNNFEYLKPCLESILRNKVSENLFHIYVVNNGHEDSCKWIYHKDVTVLTTGKNLGWEGALEYALKKTDAPYIMFLNDDVLIPPSSQMWINQLLQHFIRDDVGAVGPSSNVVMGLQNIFSQTDQAIMSVKYLIGFCFVTKREAILKAGGIDPSLPGGDDLDMSIRLRDQGYKLIVDKNIFVYHHGFKTGTRLNGEAQKINGWNSFEMLERTNHAIIKKHGFRKWVDCIQGGFEPVSYYYAKNDVEGDKIRQYIIGEKVLDLGCGGNKTIPTAIGVDLIKKDSVIDTLSNTKSDADVNADINEPLPFDDDSIDTIIARHILEHLMDSVSVLKNTHKLLKKGGRMIVAVPNNAIHRSVPMNVEHVHGFSKESLKSLFEVCGYNVIDQLDSGNGISFITIAEKIRGIPIEYES
jgi:GT2 family glycosyltransferase